MTSHDETQTVQLVLQANHDEIHGTVEQRDGTRQRFWGWLELMAALERVATAASLHRRPRPQSGPGLPPDRPRRARPTHPDGR